MSRIELTDIPSLVAQYEEDLSSYTENLTITGKTLERALKEQPTWSAYYGEKLVELDILVKYMEAQVKRVRGKLVVQYNENYNPALSERMMDKYIDKEPEYLSIYDFMLEIKGIRDKYELVLEAFNRRGFALRDLTAARVAEVQSYTL